MKKFNLVRCLAIAILVVTGSIIASGKALVPFYKVDNTSWEAKYYSAPIDNAGAPDDWYTENFDDSSWSTITSPITLANGKWQANNYSYWVRCYFNIDDLSSSKTYTFFAQHDNGCRAYINGVLIYENSSVVDYSTNSLSDEAKAALKVGKNVLCVFVTDTGGDAFMDFGLYEDDLQDIITLSDMPVTITNDAVYPWTVSGTEAQNGNKGVRNSTSWLTMEYTSTYRTELKFDWYEYNYSSHQPLQLYIDGVLTSSTSNSNWTTARFYLEPGAHMVAFRDSIGNYSSSSNRSAVRNVKIRNILPLETAVLTENSMPMSFQNNSATPWTIEDGYIEHGNWSKQRVGSTFSTTFNVEKTSKLSFNYKVANYNYDNSYNYENSHNLFVRINGIQITKAWNNINDTYWCVALEPGKYTVEWTDTVYNDYADWINYYTRIHDIELSNSWIDVELASAGTLGYEVLYSGKAKVLTDVELLKVSGPLNAADWTDIKNMTNLLALDLSEAQITEIPNNAFDGKGRINSVILPEGITRIGEYAFRGTNIRQINIPSTVTTIARYAFCGTPLQYVTFTNNSQLERIERYAFQSLSSLQSVDFGNMSKLTTIGYAAFADCPQLKEFIMPNSVNDLSYYQFHNNTSMVKLHLSDGLSYVPDFLCRNCTALKEVHLPVNTNTIRRNAFESCTSLRTIKIPETVELIQFQAFYNCGLDSIILPVQLTKLGHQTFQNCQNLRYAEMPSYIGTDNYSYIGNYNYWGDDSHRWYDTSSGWDNTFQGCPSMEKIVMRSATPPEVRNDIMNGGRAKSDITLVVPSFAVVSYKLDTYWYQFGNIVEGDDVDYWKITSPLMLTNNRRMQGKPDVDLYYGGQLTVGGNAPMPMGQFNMYVNESNPGRLLNTCDAMTADDAKTHFSVEANKWYFFTPIHDVNVADIQVTNSASYVFRYYDAQNRANNGASGSWKNVDTDKLLAGQGYIFHCNTACEIIFPADANGQAQLFRTGDVTRTLVVNEATTTANRSWNYVGNPYPAYFDIYYMDFTAPITVWTGSTYKAYSVADDELVLRPMQSFFVQKPDAVDAIVFHKEGRQLTTDIVHSAAAPARAAASNNRHVFNLAIQNGDQQDETRVVINDEASMNYEVGRDAAKFMSMDADVPQLLTLDSEGNNYAINERPMDNGNVRLAYYVGKEGFYTLHALRADGEVSVYDAELDKTIDITSEDYTFQSNATGGINTSRFTLIFKVSENTTSIQNEFGRENAESSVVYNLAGQRVAKPAKGLYIQNGKKVVRH